RQFFPPSHSSAVTPVPGVTRRNRGADRISGLPDELLHEILLRLPSTADAARTSLLSRRWRRVWAHVPAISLTDGDQEARGSSILDAVDAALAAHAAPALDRLAISLTDDWDSPRRRELDDIAARVAPWLRFASRHVAGELSLRLDRPQRRGWIYISSAPRAALKVPVCERATAIDVKVEYYGIKLRFRASGEFSALRVLKITGSFRLHERSLERAVSSQCPRLQELTLCNNNGCRRNLTIRSDSLERLKLGIEVKGTITIQTPRLVQCKMPSLFGLDRLQRAHIAAPNLAEMTWYDTYDPQHNMIDDAPRHLQKLKVRLYCLPSAMPMAALFQRFDTVDELDLRVKIPPPRLGLRILRPFGPAVLPSRIRHQEGKFECKAFLKETAKLPQCKVLKLSIDPDGLQEYSIVVLHLLRSCANARKCVLYLDLHGEKVSDFSLPIKKEHGRSSCGNLQLTTDGLVRDSLEELELNFYWLHDRDVDMMNQLLLSCGAGLKRVAIRALGGPSSELSPGKLETVAGFCRPETTIEFHMDVEPLGVDSW
ncbi:hypothetical protein EJB05_11961, partial [Eragrostis curvula]